MIHPGDLDITADSETGISIYDTYVPALQNPQTDIVTVIRPDDRKFWDKCIDLSLKGYPACGVGNLGIGKTTSTFYLLQKLLTVYKRPVVYTIRNPDGLRDLFYEFIPDARNDHLAGITVKVFKLFSYDKVSRIPSLLDANAFYIVDPGKSKGSCDDSSRIKARFIMVASNDNRLWGGEEFTKFRGPSSQVPFLKAAPISSTVKPNSKSGRFVYGCLWTAPQVLAAKQYLSTVANLDDNEVLRRFRIVGGSIRDIIEFQEEGFKQDVETALNLGTETVAKLAAGPHQFIFKEESPSSKLIGIGPKNDHSNDGGLDWTHYKISLKSDYVEERLAFRHIKMSWYEFLDEANAGNRGNLFESYVRLKFSNGPVVLEKEEVRESIEQLPSHGPKNQKKNYQQVPGGMVVGAKRTVVRVLDIITTVRNDTDMNSFFYSKNEREPLIDMIFRVKDGCDAIQSTISKTHDAEAEKIRTLKRQLCLKDNEVLRIFYAVPSCIYNTFGTNPVNPLLGEQDLTNVHIYHVSIAGNE